MNACRINYPRESTQLYTPISIKDAPVNHVSKPALHYGKPFCSRKFNLVHVH